MLKKKKKKKKKSIWYRCFKKKKKKKERVLFSCWAVRSAVIVAQHCHRLGSEKNGILVGKG